MADGEYTTLALVKADLGITDTSDDVALQAKVDAANDRITRIIGVFVGPSTDTVRTYNGSDAVEGGRRLWIPGGYRTLTQVRIANYTGGAFTVGTLGDFLVGPTNGRGPSEPYSWVDVSDYPTGSYGSYPRGRNNVELTGTFGPAAVPPELVEIATTLAKRMFKSRQTGSGDIVGTTAWGNAVFSRFLSGDDMRVLDSWRIEVGNFGSA